MAKAKAAEKKKPEKTVLTLPVSYGKVSIGENIASIPIKCTLENLSLKQAKDLCGMRIIGHIMCRAGGAQAAQESIPGIDGDLQIEGAFDVKNFSFNKKNISTSLAFMLKSIDIEQLAHFAKQEGILTAIGIEEIPEDEDDEDDEDEDDDE